MYSVIILSIIIIVIFFYKQINLTPKKNIDIFYINLQERTDRKILLEKEFIKLNNSTKYNFINRRIDAIKHIKGAIGCGKSHIKALETGKKHNLDYVIIMEDDIEIKENEIDKYFDIINNMSNWDVIILSGHGKKNLYNDDLSKAISIQTTGMYIVNKHYYDTLIKNFNEATENMEMLFNENKPINRRKWAIDINWKKLQRCDNWYIFNTNLGFQRPSYSNIEKRNVNYKHLLYKNKILNIAINKIML